MESPPIKRALISVSDKAGLTEFARGLAAAGVEIYSTGGTRKQLETDGVPVKDVSDYTGFPEMMDGRLKTLHPAVHGGILCRHDNPSDMESLAKHGILTFELVVVNLYPFEATVAKEGVTMEEAIEKIDIGGPTMVRAAAKNHAFTTIATSAQQYAEILAEVAENGCTTFETRRKLAGEAFAHTGKYDTAIAEFWAGARAEGNFPGTITTSYNRKAVLRYGENPHQEAAVYAEADATMPNVVNAEQLNGKGLSYNNLLDLDAALAIVRNFDVPAAAVLKHNNPCGAAVGETLAEALKKGMEGDPLSAFGSVIGLNRDVDGAAAEVLCEPGMFVEAIVAPDFSAEGLDILTTKPKWKDNVRLLRVGEISRATGGWAPRPIVGGLLLQDADVTIDPEDEWKVVTEAQPTDAQMAELRFAWEMVRHVKSNAIVLTKDGMLLGAGAGQMSRVDSVEISIQKAGDRAKGSAMGSDAFFPFPDGIEAAAAAGVAAVIQPGGSRKDDDVIAACNQHGMAMIFTGRRHFKH